VANLYELCLARLAEAAELRRRNVELRAANGDIMHRLTLLNGIGKQAATAAIADEVRQLRFGLLCLSSARASPSCANRTCLTPARTASQPSSSVPPGAGAEAARRGCGHGRGCRIESPRTTCSIQDA
jgi:butyrate response factor 1